MLAEALHDGAFVSSLPWWCGLTCYGMVTGSVGKATSNLICRSHFSPICRSHFLKNKHVSLVRELLDLGSMMYAPPKVWRIFRIRMGFMSFL